MTIDCIMCNLSKAAVVDMDIALGKKLGKAPADESRAPGK